MLLSLVILLIRSFFLRKANISFKLFVEARRNENSGHFEAAVITYENALDKVKKSRFNSNNLKNRIVEKLKTLRTLIEYKNNLHFTRRSEY